MAVRRFEHWQRELITLATETRIPLDEPCIEKETGVAISGATKHKLESAEISGPVQIDGVDTTLWDNLSWAGWQAIRWIPYQDVGHDLWGLIIKHAIAYDLRKNELRLPIIRDIGYLLHSRIVGNGSVAISGVGVKADDFMKDLVASSFAGATPDGTSKLWGFGGTLAVAGDNGEAVELTDLDEWEGYLDEVLNDIGEKYDVDWELQPTIAGDGSITYTFETKSPRGGTDRTSGAARVVIDGYAGSAPRGERFLDKSTLVTEYIEKGGEVSTPNVAQQAIWGLWEGVTDSETEDAREVDLELAAAKAGSLWEYESWAMGPLTPATDGQICEWMNTTHGGFEIGDLVVKSNARTGETEASSKIEAIAWEWPDRVLHTQIRWGDKKPTHTEKNKQKGGSRGRGVEIAPLIEDDDGQIMPVALANVAGDSRKTAAANHEHLLWITADDAGVMGITDGIGYIAGEDGVSTRIDNDGKLQISGAGACLWQRTEGPPDYLHQKTHGDWIRLYDVGDGLAFEINGDGDVTGNEQAIGAPYRRFSITDYDIIGGGGSGSGVHDIIMSGNLVSDPSTTASVLQWTGGTDGDDQAWFKWLKMVDSEDDSAIYGQWWHGFGLAIYRGDDLMIYSDAGITLKFYVDGLNGDTIWGAGATLTFNGAVYTPPLAYPAGNGYSLVCTTLGVWSWYDVLGEIITDHGELDPASLLDDDHPHYHTDARHAALASAATTHVGRSAVAAAAPGAPYQGMLWWDEDAEPEEVATPADIWFWR